MTTSTPTDLSLGGIVRQGTRIYLGPSLGWIDWPGAIYPLVAAGTYQITPGYSLITVNVAGAVTVILPTTILPTNQGAQAALLAPQPITIVDVGGNALNNPITIEPFQGTGETIMNLNSIALNSNYGSWTLAPNAAQKTWNSISL